MVRRNPALRQAPWCHCAAVLGNPEISVPSTQNIQDSPSAIAGA